jgi:hypothetical protein
MVKIPGYLILKNLYSGSILKKHENVIKMKNKPDPALWRPSNLSNDHKKENHNLVKLQYPLYKSHKDLNLIFIYLAYLGMFSVVKYSSDSAVS